MTFIFLLYFPSPSINPITIVYTRPSWLYNTYWSNIKKKNSSDSVISQRLENRSSIRARIYGSLHWVASWCMHTRRYIIMLSRSDGHGLQPIYSIVYSISLTSRLPHPSWYLYVCTWLPVSPRRHHRKVPRIRGGTRHTYVRNCCSKVVKNPFQKLFKTFYLYLLKYIKLTIEMYLNTYSSIRIIRKKK